MADEFSGEYPTVTPTRAWTAARADGIRALVFEDLEGKRMAFELTAAQCRSLAAELAKLAALPQPPDKPIG